MVSLLHFWHFLALLCVCSLECISNSLQPCYRIFFAVHPEEKNLLCLNERLHYCICFKLFKLFSGCVQFFPERSLFFTVWLEKSLSLLADVEQVLYVNVVSFVRQLQYFHCCRGYCSDSLYCFIRYYGFGCC